MQTLQEKTAGVKLPTLSPVQVRAVHRTNGSSNGSFLQRHQHTSRPEVWGKFLWADGKKFHIKGVTYGPFGPGPDGSNYGSDQIVDADFKRIAAAGFNTIRTYAAPPRRLLDAAVRNGLRVMVGCGWDQHVAFLEDSALPREIRRRIGESVRTHLGHPGVLCHVVGNEIPASIVRWYGAKRIERFIGSLYQEAKNVDPDALVTYVNYPTTEYLKVPGDFSCFNVYLERREQLASYLARLHNLAGDKPLVLAEVGLDSSRNGEHTQGESLAWQIETAFLGGCAGAVVFSWTDEWFHNGAEMGEWAFGLTRQKREPKPALEAVRQAFGDAPFPQRLSWPRISVVVCSFNGSRTIARCCKELSQLDYPDYEVIVVDDGSTDDTAAIAAQYPVRVIRTENRGLSAARNVGAAAADGEIVAYIDDDAWPDEHWLRHLAIAFGTGRFGGVGGLNIPPPSDGRIADCVANAPGGPIHVLLTDDEAEHIPGCNMAFRRDVLFEVGGLDPQFRVAGDDVDLCWRVLESGWKLGYSPAAVVWHHRRGSIRGYYRQQWCYGKAEALLEQKWPERYNMAGHVSWAGRIYADHLIHILHPRPLIYQGVWGTAPFQAIYPSPSTALQQLASLPEWYFFIVITAGLSLLGLAWKPLFLALPFFAATVTLVLAQAFKGASQAVFPTRLTSPLERARRYLTTALLHLIQPIARLRGRLHWGLTPWRLPTEGLVAPGQHQFLFWPDRWRGPAEWIADVARHVRSAPAVVTSGGGFDDWDLRVQHGLFAVTMLRFAVEEHGRGQQLVRVRVRPRLTPAAAVTTVGATLLGLAALLSGSGIAATGLVGLAAVVAWRAMCEASTSVRAVERAMRHTGSPTRQELGVGTIVE